MRGKTKRSKDREIHARRKPVSLMGRAMSGVVLVGVVLYYVISHNGPAESIQACLSFKLVFRIFRLARPTPRVLHPHRVSDERSRPHHYIIGTTVPDRNYYIIMYYFVCCGFIRCVRIARSKKTFGTCHVLYTI